MNNPEPTNISKKNKTICSVHLNVAIKKVKLEIVLANSLLHVFNFQATLWLCRALWVLTTFWQRSGHNFVLPLVVHACYCDFASRPSFLLVIIIKKYYYQVAGWIPLTG